MTKENEIFLNRVRELSEKAYSSNRWMFTDFLSLDEQSEILKIKKELRNPSFFGGAEGCERVMAVFGNAEELGYTEDCPITCIKAEFSSFDKGKLTHRDFLGAMMSLGIDRCKTGDIIISENCAYIFAEEKIAPFIIENLIQVRHCTVSCSLSEIPEGTELFRTEEKTVNIASYRADCLVAAVFNLSRTKVDAYFEAQQVFVNGKVCKKSDTPTDGDIVSVRHLGRFRLGEQSGTSKKGRYFVKILVYV